MSRIFSNKAVRTILIIILLFAAIAVLMVLAIRARRIPPNPPGTIGNTAGNLNNRGYFCEYDGTVYFANAFDGGALYAMAPDEGQIKKLNSTQICNILAGGNYLYYFQLGGSRDGGLSGVRIPRSFSRCDLNGEHVTSLTRDTVVTGQLVGDYLYLLAEGDGNPFFYKMKIDKSDQASLADYTINPACAAGGAIYYNGTQGDHHLYALNTSNDTFREVWNGNLWYPVLDGDYVYYMDLDNNYRICRYSMSRDVVEVLTNDRADCFNVGNGYVYYQKNGDNPQLICMRTDGSDAKVVASGNCTHINMTSRYVYFQYYGEDNTLYHSYLGSDYAEPFNGARESALANQKSK